MKHQDLIHGDCLDILSWAFEDNSIDALVTDPPAGISFMGKSWDSDKGGRDKWVKWLSSVMRECFRVMKPGAHGLVWSLPRTSHWTAMALEDAGFEVRDCITHLFGSGFPKSLDISKAIDKAAGASREIIGRQNYSAPDIRNNSYDQAHVADRERLSVPITKASTDAAKQWQGFGTALKPAAEFWWLVRKPISEKTVAANVLKWGVGGLNIDGCRVSIKSQDNIYAKNPHTKHHDEKCYSGGWKSSVYKVPEGRFPANLVFSHSPYCTDTQCDIDCAIKQLDEQSLAGGMHSAGKARVGGAKQNNDGALFGVGNHEGNGTRIGDSGGASRFFYCAKVSPSERNAGCEHLPEIIRPNGNKWTDQDYRVSRGERPPSAESGPKRNHHPTVKPQKLMRYLCRLITPPNGVVLDPFMGSGSTGLAAKSEGFRFIGIEKEKEYFEIAKARLK